MDDVDMINQEADFASLEAQVIVNFNLFLGAKFLLGEISYTIRIP